MQNDMYSFHDFCEHKLWRKKKGLQEITMFVANLISHITIKKDDDGYFRYKIEVGQACIIKGFEGYASFNGAKRDLYFLIKRLDDTEILYYPNT